MGFELDVSGAVLLGLELLLDGVGFVLEGFDFVGDEVVLGSGEVFAGPVVLFEGDEGFLEGGLKLLAFGFDALVEDDSLEVGLAFEGVGVGEGVLSEFGKGLDLILHELLEVEEFLQVGLFLLVSDLLRGEDVAEQ